MRGEHDTQVQLSCAVEKSGERMAVLTTLVGLLVMKHEDLEGEGGTGSLEEDMEILEVSVLAWAAIETLTQKH